MGLGRFLACTFNALFLGMSGLLLGLKWKANGGGRLPNNFLIHRLVKLAKTYYPFLLLMFIFYGVFTDYPLTVKDVVMHIAFLPWFDKLHGFGHRWFMTMIVICYVGVYVISRISFKIKQHYPHFMCRGGGQIYINPVCYCIDFPLASSDVILWVVWANVALFMVLYFMFLSCCGCGRLDEKCKLEVCHFGLFHHRMFYFRFSCRSLRQQSTACGMARRTWCHSGCDDCA